MYDNRTFVTLRQVSSVSMVQGAVTGLIQELISKKFTKGYFKNFYVSTSLASVREETSEEDQDRIIKENPILALDVNYNLSNRPISEYPSLDRKFSYADDIPEFIINRMDVLFADENDVKIHFDLYRIKIDYQVTIRLETELEAWDVATYINSIFRAERPFYINKRVLPCQIPTTLIYSLAKFQGYDLTKPEDVISFEKYLKIYSRDFLSISRNMSTGKDVVFFNLPTNLLIKPESTVEINKNVINKSNDKSTVTLTLSTELNIPTQYVLKAPSNLENIDLISEGIVEEGRNIKANIVIYKASAPDTWENKNLILFRGFVTDNNSIISKIDFKDILPEQIIEFIKFTEDQFTSVVLWMNDVPVEEDNFRLIYETGFLELFIPLKNMSYHLAVYIDLSEFKKFVEGQNEFSSINEMAGG